MRFEREAITIGRREEEFASRDERAVRFGEGCGLIGDVFEDVSRDDEREAFRPERRFFGAATNEANFFGAEAEFVETFARDDEPAERDVGAPKKSRVQSETIGYLRLITTRYHVIRVRDRGEEGAGAAAQIEDRSLFGDRSDRVEPGARS